MKLPDEYLSSMKKILKNDFDKFIKSCDEPAFRAVRINTLKCSIEQAKNILPLRLKQTPFAYNSFYISGDIEKIGSNPLHHAGVFYVQEPSASSAVAALAPKPGDRVLDLCAAPGGKSTQIAECLAGSGLLWSNEIVKNRARILLSNIERMGVRNAVVSSCHPETLCSRLAGFFDKVLVDAPCSGEGMFRRNNEAIAEWSQEHVESCAIRQLSILNTASRAVRCGGTLVYSTCTFSIEENECVVNEFLKNNSNFILEKIDEDFGRCGIEIDGNTDLNKTRRIFPMDGGEGHFVAKFIRIGENVDYPDMYEYSYKDRQNIKMANELFSGLFKINPYGKVQVIGDKAMMLPSGLPSISGLGVIRAGVLMGEIKKGRIEPAHSLFISANKDELRNVLNFDAESEEIKKYLQGLEIDINSNLNSYVGVSVNNILVGFGKCSNNKLKNKYPKGLRNN